MSTSEFLFKKVQYDTGDMSDELRSFVELYSASQTETGEVQDLTDEEVDRYLDRIDAADAYAVYDGPTGTLVGAALVNTDETRLWVEGIAVDPEYRDAGLGTRTMRKLAGEALRLGLDKMSGLAQPNESTLEFYRRRGFYEDDTIGAPGAYGELIPMSVDLPEPKLADRE